MLVLDHLAVLGADLQSAVEHVEGVFECTMGAGGQHARFGTHNRLMGHCDDLYLEPIATDPDAPPPQDARWFGLDHFSGPPRLDKWVCRVADIEAAVVQLPVEPRIVVVERGDLKWRMLVPTDGFLPFDGLFPALIEWKTPVLPGVALAGQEWALTALTITHPEASKLQSILAPYLNDDRIRFETGATPHLCADFNGPFKCQLT